MTERIDHAEASSGFIAASDHLEFHDRRLWDLRGKRDRATAAIPEWEELRTLASQIKEHTLTHLGAYLEQFERAAQANGVTVHWARDAAEHNQVVYDILAARGAKTLVKAKSMLTDECEMRAFLEPRGIEVIVSADMSCLMHQKGCAERMGLPLRFMHIAQVLNGSPLT